MSERRTVYGYLAGEPTMRPRELRFGVVREPPAPGFHHQIVVGRLYSRLERHVLRYAEGRVVISPVDVVLDRRRALVVQPDIVFVSVERQHLCTEQIWGPPDLAIEVLSATNGRHDCTVKVGWYREYGVRECWLVDPAAGHVEVIDLQAPDHSTQLFAANQIVRSRVLARLRLRIADVLMG